MTFWVAGAVVGSGVIGASASRKAAETQARAAESAADAQLQASREANALQERMYKEGVARQQPYYQAGVNALAQLQGRTNAMPSAFQYEGQQPAAFQYEGQQPAAFQFRAEDMQTDPGYGFRLSEGLKALERSAAARGGLLSGGTGKALTRYGQEAASQEFGNAFARALTGYGLEREREADQYGRALTGYGLEREREADQYGRALTGYGLEREREAEEYNRLAGMAGVGGTTAQQINAAGQNFASQSGQNLLAGGQAAAQGMLGAAGARASGYIGGANALTGALGAYLNYNQSQQMMNLLRPGAGMSMYSAPGFSNTPSYLVTPGGL
jgi:hypothetical protein